jgi:ankyrin repeat protein
VGAMQVRSFLEEQSELGLSQLVNNDVLCLNMISYFNLEDFAHLRVLNKKFSIALKDDYWESQVKRYFPDNYKKSRGRAGINWFEFFKHLYHLHYHGLPARTIKIFLSVLFGDIAALNAFKVVYDDLFLKNRKGEYLYEVVGGSRNQHLMDYFFKEFVIARRFSSRKGEELKFAVLLNQAVFIDEVGQAEIKSMISSAVINSESSNLNFPAKHGYVDVVRKLVEISFLTESKSKFFEMLLISAVKSGCADVVDLLFSYDEEIKTSDHLLHLAAESGDDRVFDVVAENFDIFSAWSHNGSTLLHSVIRGRNNKIFNNVVNRMKGNLNVSIDSVDSWGKTPLHLAAEYGCFDIFGNLLSLKADISKTIGSGEVSVLHSAVKGGDCAIVNLILNQYKIDINVRDSLGRTPLHYVFLSESHFSSEMIDILIDAGADVNAVTERRLNALPESGINKQTPLHYAARSRNAFNLKKLLSLDVNAASTKGKDPVLCEVSEIEDCSSRVFLNRKADIFAVDEDGNTPLHAAFCNENKEIIEALLEAGSPVDVVNKDKQTAFHRCVAAGKLSNVEAFFRQDKRVRLNSDVFSDVKELDFSMVSISLEALAVVLKATPNLEFLNLSNIRIIPSLSNDCSNLELPCFSRLVGVNFEGCELSELPLLRAILKASPNIGNLEVGEKLSDEMNLGLFQAYLELFKLHRNPFFGRGFSLMSLFKPGKPYSEHFKTAETILSFLGEKELVCVAQEKIKKMSVSSGGLFSTPAEASEKRPSDGCNSPSKRQKK